MENQRGKDREGWRGADGGGETAAAQWKKHKRSPARPRLQMCNSRILIDFQIWTGVVVFARSATLDARRHSKASSDM